jgi:hypothetical protein
MDNIYAWYIDVFNLPTCAQCPCAGTPGTTPPVVLKEQAPPAPPRDTHPSDIIAYSRLLIFSPHRPAPPPPGWLGPARTGPGSAAGGVPSPSPRRTEPSRAAHALRHASGFEPGGFRLPGADAMRAVSERFAPCALRSARAIRRTGDSESRTLCLPAAARFTRMGLCHQTATFGRHGMISGICSLDRTRSASPAHDTGDSDRRESS